MTPPELDELERLLAAATPGPWIRRWESKQVHWIAGDDALTSQQDIDLACAAVNALPALIAAARQPDPALDPGPNETMLRLLHHAAREHLRVWHGSMPFKDRRLPLRELINATDLAGEHLGEPPVSKEKQRRLRDALSQQLAQPPEAT
jgi:hypothetical protein